MITRMKKNIVNYNSYMLHCRGTASPLHSIHVPGSDGTTVGARTEDAKALARCNLKHADSSAEKTPEEPKDPAPILNRAVKSEPVLEQTEAAAVATAAKAKPTPPKREPPDETSQSSPEHHLRAKAVQDSLKRSSTNDIANQSADAKKESAVKQPKAAKKAPEDPDRPDPDDPDSSSEDSAEMRKKEEQIKKKKAIHARYMRFSRSLTSYLANQWYVGNALNSWMHTRCMTIVFNIEFDSVHQSICYVPQTNLRYMSRILFPLVVWHTCRCMYFNCQKRVARFFKKMGNPFSHPEAPKSCHLYPKFTNYTHESLLFLVARHTLRSPGSVNLLLGDWSNCWARFA